MVVVPRERIPLALRGWGDAAMEQQWVIDSTRIRSDLGYEELVPRDEAMQGLCVSGEERRGSTNTLLEGR